MRVSPAGLALIQAWEGIEDGDPSTVLLDPYIDMVGIYTIGWGHVLLTPAGQQININVFGRAKAKTLATQAMIRMFGVPAITREKAEELLRADIVSFENAVAGMVAKDTTQNQFDAMVAFAFNVGKTGLSKSSLLRLHNAGKRAVGTLDVANLIATSKAQKAPTNIPQGFTSWSYAAKKWTRGLFRRRCSEALVYGGMPGAQAFKQVQAYAA
ncbi:endolysin [Caulobacter phage CcrBL9]|uniref:Lysozyme n=1 Tax=Caulobacter phage CcrBL9 TaxID=2283270 RepID=A0A385EBE6_9CAUD|nr:endolysin [Caulobacter phage CcrBL9]AXQ69204.1 lysozyme [Caulobacter phage CcrBL9]